MSDDYHGLSTAEANRRLAEAGPNDPVRVRRLSAAVQLARLFANPLVLILIAASVISATLGQQTDAVIIITIVLLGIGINFWETFRSERAADRLRASVAPTATVERDGVWREIPIRVVVPGDLFRLSAGDLIPADGRLLESRDLSVQQALLTGESLPVDKHAGHGDMTAAASGDTSLVFLGTSVVSGTATAVAIATGPNTRLRRYRPSTGVTNAGFRVRARTSAVQPAHSPDDDGAGAVHFAGLVGPAPRSV